MQRLNTYKMTAWVKLTIEIDAPDDDHAWDDAQSAQFSEWAQTDFEIVDCENMGLADYDHDTD